MPRHRLLTPTIGPPVLWRTSLRCLLLSLLCVAIAFGTLFYRGAIAKQGRVWHRYTIMAAGFSPALIVYPIGYLIQRRVVREWKRTKGRLCARCAYDLTAHPDAGICPECGYSYDLGRDAEMWEQAGLKSTTTSGTTEG